MIIIGKMSCIIYAVFGINNMLGIGIGKVAFSFHAVE